MRENTKRILKVVAKPKAKGEMIIKTSPEKPWLILIHGLGVTEKVWFAPLEEKTKFISFKTLLREEKEVTPFAERRAGRYNIASWAQNPYSTIDGAALELKNLVGTFESPDFVFIAHSRGGLVARRAVQKYSLKPKALICLATPHYGSRLADFVMRHFKIITTVMPSLKSYELPISELSTCSGLIGEMNSQESLEKEQSITHFDICGSSTHFFTVNIPFFQKTIKLFHVLDSFEVCARSILIPEMKNREGDGFVSVDSCKPPLTPPENFSVMPVNHASILVNGNVFNAVDEILGNILRDLV